MLKPCGTGSRDRATPMRLVHERAVPAPPDRPPSAVGQRSREQALPGASVASDAPNGHSFVTVLVTVTPSCAQLRAVTSCCFRPVARVAAAAAVHRVTFIAEMVVHLDPSPVCRTWRTVSRPLSLVSATLSARASRDQLGRPVPQCRLIVDQRDATHCCLVHDVNHRSDPLRPTVFSRGPLRSRRVQPPPDSSAPKVESAV
jgi:hypothetical protein